MKNHARKGLAHHTRGFWRLISKFHFVFISCSRVAILYKIVDFKPCLFFPSLSLSLVSSFMYKK